jgi:MerR family mercuric resistance operon transcriptional regulator
MQDASLTIGRLARAAGVPVSTIRFYERRGILRPDGRSESNYRRYSRESVERLKLVRCGQGIGLSLKDVKELLRMVDSEKSPCKDIDKLLRARLADIRQRMRDLRKLERALVRSLESCCCSDSPSVCETVIRIKRDGKCPVEFCDSGA